MVQGTPARDHRGDYIIRHVGDGSIGYPKEAADA
jgi:hypothetical protein